MIDYAAEMNLSNIIRNIGDHGYRVIGLQDRYGTPCTVTPGMTLGDIMTAIVVGRHGVILFAPRDAAPDADADPFPSLWITVEQGPRPGMLLLDAQRHPDPAHPWNRVAAAVVVVSGVTAYAPRQAVWRALRELAESAPLPYWEAVRVFLRTYRHFVTPEQAQWVSTACGAPADFIAETYPGVILTREAAQ